LLNLMAFLASRSKELEAENPNLRLTNCGTIEMLIQKAVRLQQQALYAPNDANPQTGLKNLAILVPISTAKTLDTLAINASLIDFRMRKSNGVSEQLRDQLGELIVASSAISTNQRDIAFSRLALPRTLGDAPFLKRILNDTQLEQLNAQIVTRAASQTETDFLTGVIASGGTTGSSDTVVLGATDILVQSTRDLTLAERRKILKNLDLGTVRANMSRSTQRRIGERLQQMQEP
jgi:hypothetical protein